MISVEHFPKVRAEFPIYEAFRAQNKIAQANPVLLSRESPNLPFIGRTDLRFGWDGFHCIFQAERSPKAALKYALKIFAAYFDEKPCLRFDSRGSTHLNPETGDGLPARAVSTPHFHRVDVSGNMIAYKTPALLDAAESAKVVTSPQLGTNLFCQEVNLFSQEGEFVAVENKIVEMDLSIEDPLSGAVFPQQ